MENMVDLGRESEDFDGGGEYYEEWVEANEYESAKKKRKSVKGRKLHRWEPDDDQFLLLALGAACALEGITLPWDRAAKMLDSNMSGESVKQHLPKVHVQREADGRPCPPKVTAAERRIASKDRRAAVIDESLNTKEASRVIAKEIKKGGKTSSPGSRLLPQKNTPARKPAVKKAAGAQTSSEKSTPTKPVRKTPASKSKRKTQASSDSDGSDADTEVKKGGKRTRSVIPDREIQSLDNGSPSKRTKTTGYLRSRETVNYAEPQAESDGEEMVIKKEEDDDTDIHVAHTPKKSSKKKQENVKSSKTTGNSDTTQGHYEAYANNVQPGTTSHGDRAPDAEFPRLFSSAGSFQGQAYGRSPNYYDQNAFVGPSNAREYAYSNQAHADQYPIGSSFGNLRIGGPPPVYGINAYEQMQPILNARMPHSDAAYINPHHAQAFNSNVSTPRPGSAMSIDANNYPPAMHRGHNNHHNHISIPADTEEYDEIPIVNATGRGEHVVDHQGFTIEDRENWHQYGRNYHDEEEQYDAGAEEQMESEQNYTYRRPSPSYSPQSFSPPQVPPAPQSTPVRTTHAPRYDPYGERRALIEEMTNSLVQQANARAPAPVNPVIQMQESGIQQFLQVVSHGNPANANVALPVSSSGSIQAFNPWGVNETLADHSGEFMEQAGPRHEEEIKFELPSSFDTTYGTEHDEFRHTPPSDGLSDD